MTTTEKWYYLLHFTQRYSIEVYLGPCQISMMENFSRIITCFELLPIFEKFRLRGKCPYVRIFSHSDSMQRDTLYLSVFNPNAGKCGPEKLRIRALFKQCPSKMFNRFLNTPLYQILFILVWKTHDNLSSILS